MKLGLYFAAFDDLPLDRALERAKELGFETIEISCHTGGRFPVEHLRSEGTAFSIRNMVERAGLRISALNMSSDSQLILGPHNHDTDVIISGTPEEKVRFGTERMIAAADLAREMEVGVVTGFVGCDDYSRWFPWPDASAWERMEGALVERWGPILQYFENLELKFAVEPHPRQMVYNTESALRMVELLGKYQSLTFNLDPANLMLAGVDPVIFASELGTRIANVHAKDGELVAHNAGRSGLLANGRWDRLDRGFRFRVPGWGDVQWRALVTELSLQGYRGPMTVENEDPTMGAIEGVEKAAQFLSPLLIRVPGPRRVE